MSREFMQRWGLLNSSRHRDRQGRPFFELSKLSPALRLGLRLVKGLKEAAADRIATQRRARAYDSFEDMVERCDLDRADVAALAAAGALRGFTSNRYRAHWQAAGIEAPTPLFMQPRFNEAEPMLNRPGALAETVADYNSTGLTLGRHPLSFLRERLDGMDVRRAEDLWDHCNHAPVKVAGLVTCRQRPDTASGVMFVTLEDETGSINLIVWPKVIERQRHAFLHSQIVLVHGTLQREEDVIHVIAGRARDCSDWLGGMEVRSRNFADGIRVIR